MTSISHVIDLVKILERKIDDLLLSLERQRIQIETLKERNSKLEEFYSDTVQQIEEYIRELEQIRKQHADCKYNSQ
jgi:FtsZ-binding cell division protein ZapB